MEVLSNIGFDWQVALANFVSFLIIFFILKQKVFGPVGKILDERKEKMSSGLAKALESEEKSKRAEQESQELLMQARSKANTLVADAQGKADAIVAEASTKAQEEASKILEQNKERIEHEQNIAMREIGKEASRLVVLGVEKVLGKKVDNEQDLALAQATLAQLEEHKTPTQG
jgi:F-type H+-transporting ATPase subunit b